VYPNGKVVSKKGTCPVGSVDFYLSIGMQGHNGLDHAAIHGESVVHGATFPGWMKIEKDEQGGIGVDVVSNEPIRFPGYPPPGLTPVATYEDGFSSYVKMRYWHLKTAIGWDGKAVGYGTIIGLADNTGASSGDHLHWSPKWCDKDGKGLNNTNGYAGAFDPTPYYRNDIFAGDSAGHLGLVSPISEQERKELMSQLSAIRYILLGLRELIYKL
jgi:hypothetical protein